MDTEQITKLRERLLQCPVCTEEYKDPRILPCHHTLCLRCIQRMIDSPKPSKSFPCPLCTTTVHIPKGGTTKLPINYYLSNLQEELGARGYFGFCDVCEKGPIPVQFQCIDCNIDLCKFCVPGHRLNSHGPPHNTIRVPTGLSSGIPLLQPCSSHTEEQCYIFCCSCSQAICITCFYDDHKLHKTVPLSKHLQETSGYFQGELERLLEEKRNVLSAREEVEMLKHELASCHDSSIEALTAVAREVCQLILSRVQIILSKIEHSFKEEEEKIKRTLSDYEAYLQQVEKGLSFLLDLEKPDICVEAKDAYKSFLAQLNTARTELSSKQLNLKESKFVSSSFSTVFGLDCLGKHAFHVGKLGRLSEGNRRIHFDKNSLKPVTSAYNVDALKLFRLGLFFLSIIFYFLFLMFPTHLFNENLTDFYGFVKSKIDKEYYYLVTVIHSYYGTARSFVFPHQ